MGGNPQSGAGRLRDAPRSLEALGAQVGAGPRPTSLHPTPRAPAKPPGPWAELSPLCFSPLLLPSPPRSPAAAPAPLSRRPGGDEGPTRCTAGSSQRGSPPPRPSPAPPSLAFSFSPFSFHLLFSPLLLRSFRLAFLLLPSPPREPPCPHTAVWNAPEDGRCPETDPSALLIFSCSALRRR